MYSEKIKYSFIIPTYNSEKTIFKCLNSVLNQENCDYEVLIIDDGSTDNTLNIVTELSKKNDKIKIKKNSHKGISEIRNIGICNSIGDYIIFVDSDDYVNPELLSVLNKYDDDVIKFSVFCSNGGDRFVQPKFISITGMECLKLFCNSENIFATPWGYAFRRSLFLNNKLFFLKGKTHEDFGLIPLVLIYAKTVSSIEYVGYNYIKRVGSITQETEYEKEISRMYDFIDQFCFVIGSLNNMNIEQSYKKIYNDYFINRLYIKFNNFKRNIKEYYDYDEVVKKCCKKINTFLIKQKLNYRKFT